MPATLSRLSLVLILLPGCYVGAGEASTESGDAGVTVGTGGSPSGPAGPEAGDTGDDTTGGGVTTGGVDTAGGVETGGVTTDGVDTSAVTTGGVDTGGGVSTNGVDTTGVGESTGVVDTGVETSSAEVTGPAEETTAADDTGPAEGCTAQAIELIDLVNNYRESNGQPAIPASKSLCTVADTHVHDLADNNPHGQPGCNLHSWSNQGPWSACCYTADHAQAECMWAKPSELTVYPGNGYENAASGVQSPMQALQLWQGSQGHNAVILNQGSWSNFPWGSVGAGLYNGYAVLWFGQEADPG